MSILLERIESYKKDKFSQLESHYQGLKSSQSPHTLIVTCSDSRLCPQEFGQSEAGELFVVRNAGNLIPPYDPQSPSNEGLTIEYGVVALNVQELIVCGHVSCGAMGGLMDLDKLAALPLVRQGLANYKSHYADEIDQCDSVESLIDWNVKKQLSHLHDYPFIPEKIASGDLMVHGMVYDFVQGKAEKICHLNSDGTIVAGPSKGKA